MAYGKLKVDTLVYDNSGTDVEKPMVDLVNAAPLNSPAFTGTVQIPAGASISGFAPLASPVLTGTPTVPGYMPLAGGAMTGDLQIDNAKKFILSETDANGSHYLSFKAPDSVTANVDFTLPDGDGTNGQLLQTNGAGVLSWSTTDLSSYAPLASPALTGTATADNLTISGTLTVNGTTTEINSTTLTVDDKNIELGTVATPTDTTADGGGITLKGATDKTILWTDATDSWDFNQDIKTSGKVTDSKGDVRTIPKIIKSSGYTPADTSDVGKVIFISTGGVTINNNVYDAGDVITIINDSGSDQTITQGTATIYNTGDASTGNRTLAGRGIATIWFAAHNEAYISGSGLS